MRTVNPAPYGDDPGTKGRAGTGPRQLARGKGSAGPAHYERATYAEDIPS